MRMDYDDFAAELSRSYPKTPERFQRMVSQEVCVQPKIPTNYTQVYDEISANKQFISDILQK